MHVSHCKHVPSDAAPDPLNNLKGFGIVTDLVFAVLPVFMLWNIQVNTRVKLALCAIMALGILYVLSDLASLSQIFLPNMTQPSLHSFRKPKCD